jgi:hypothetical protein
LDFLVEACGLLLLGGLLTLFHKWAVLSMTMIHCTDVFVNFYHFHTAKYRLNYALFWFSGGELIQNELPILSARG